MQRADCEAHRRRRASALPMVMLLAERLSRISAPASAAAVEGGSGTQTSSHISTCMVKGDGSLGLEQKINAKRRALPRDLYFVCREYRHQM